MSLWQHKFAPRPCTVGLRIQHCCSRDAGCSCGSDSILPWEFPHAVVRSKKKKKNVGVCILTWKIRYSGGAVMTYADLFKNLKILFQIFTSKEGNERGRERRREGGRDRGTEKRGSYVYAHLKVCESGIPELREACPLRTSLGDSSFGI